MSIYVATMHGYVQVAIDINTACIPTYIIVYQASLFGHQL